VLNNFYFQMYDCILCNKKSFKLDLNLKHFEEDIRIYLKLPKMYQTNYCVLYKHNKFYEMYC